MTPSEVFMTPLLTSINVSIQCLDVRLVWGANELEVRVFLEQFPGRADFLPEKVVVLTVPVKTEDPHFRSGRHF